MLPSPPMQVILQPLQSSLNEGSATVVDTSPTATIETLISAFCTKKGISFNSKLAIFDAKKHVLPEYSTLSSLGIGSGQNLHIGYKDSSFVFKDKWPLLIAFAALIIGLLCIFTVSMVYGLSGGYPSDYGVVMDAGSSKTNTIVYKWPSNKHNGTGCVFQEDDCLAKGGIAKMDPMKLEPVIECAKKVTERVKPESRPKTPLYFAATAGMRLLNLTNPDKLVRILDQLSNRLNETGLSVKAIEIISGTDEGVYGWITSNFLQKTLEVEKQLDPWIPTTLGALDMGGASMQISYALPPGEQTHDRSEVRSIQLYGQTHDVYSRSNLCFGRDEAQRRYRSFLIKDPTKITQFDPCLPDGYILNVNASDIFNQPCTRNKINEKWLEDDKGILNIQYDFVGTSDTAACHRNVSRLLNANHCTEMEFKECFKKLNNLVEDQKYLAFASYFYTTDFLKVTSSPLKTFESVMENFCRKSYNDIQQLTDNEYAQDYCFNAQYIHEVLVNGFGFSEKTWKNLEFVGKIAGKDVGWTLGYMINATNIIPEKLPYPRLISAVSLTVLLVLFILTVIATAIFIAHTNCRKRNAPGREKKSRNLNKA